MVIGIGNINVTGQIDRDSLNSPNLGGDSRAAISYRTGARDGGDGVDGGGRGAGAQDRPRQYGEKPK